jgi:hypothetical protein
MRIRKHQMALFKEAGTRAFEDEMLPHLARFAPKHAEMLGERGMRRLVRVGLDRAERHGLTHRGPVRLYIELMLLFGGGFEADPLLPWAGRVFGHRRITTQALRADALWVESMGYIQIVYGTDRALLQAALGRLRERLDHLSRASVMEEDEDTTVARLHETFPARLAFASEVGARESVRAGRETARSHGIATPLGTALCVDLAFFLGHGFAADPVYPWAEEILADPQIPTANFRAERLRSAAASCLAHLMA